ncbi:MAG: hypothetical protein JWP19_1795 [Rhodoglobus sp.]|nr:hypothetical protein [Rhodoglobus sp.]
MGVLDDMGRLIGNGLTAPLPNFSESVKQAADLSDQAKAAQQGGVVPGAGGYGANPFANLAAMNAAIPGSGVVTALTDTGQKFETTTIYDVSLDVTLDGQPPYPVVHRQMIAAAALGGWQVGKVISLRVDPVDKTKVMLG